MKLQLTNTNQFVLKGTKGRWLHLATIIRGMQEYIYIMDRMTSMVYIEEVTGGSLTRIEDNKIHEELCKFVEEKKLNKFTKAE